VVDEFQRLGFKHETKKLLVRFHFQDDGLSIEAFLKKDFIGWKLLEARVAKDESVVHIADVFDEEMMVGKELVEVDGPNLSTDGNNHEAKGWGEWAAHRASPSLSECNVGPEQRFAYQAPS